MPGCSAVLTCPCCCGRGSISVLVGEKTQKTQSKQTFTCPLPPAARRTNLRGASSQPSAVSDSCGLPVTRSCQLAEEEVPRISSAVCIRFEDLLHGFYYMYHPTLSVSKVKEKLGVVGGVAAGRWIRTPPVQPRDLRRDPQCCQGGKTKSRLLHHYWHC